MAAQCENQDWQCNKSFLECSKHMFEHGVATDVTFLVGASEEVVQAHKFVLVARSPVFETMLCGLMQENPTGIKLPDTDTSAFRDFLTFLYTDDKQIKTNNAVGLHYLATKYMVPALQKAASDFMQSNMCTAPDLLCSTFNYSVITDDTALQESCIQGFSKQKDGVMKSDHFLELSKDAVTKLAENNELAVPEVLLFNGCNRWAEHQCNKKDVPADGLNKRAELEDIIPLMRFPLMSAAEFAEDVSKEGILSLEEIVAMFQFFSLADKPPVPYCADPRKIPNLSFTLHLQYFPSVYEPIFGKQRKHTCAPNRTVSGCSRQSGSDLKTLFQTQFGSYFSPGRNIFYNDTVVSDSDVVNLTEGAVVYYR